MKPLPNRLAWIFSAVVLLILVLATIRVSGVGLLSETTLLAAPSAKTEGKMPEKGPSAKKEATGKAAARKESKPSLPRTEAEWKRRLTPEQYYVLRRKGTEPAFSNAYWDNHRQGTYHCAGCGEPLFHSDDKYESGTGWPSSTAPIARNSVQTRLDRSFFTVRTEVICRHCKGHLGHVFEDGPAPTGMRYCMNSTAMKFVDEDGSGDE